MGFEINDWCGRHSFEEKTYMAKKEEKIRILFLAANPLDTGRLDLEEEVREIEKKLEAAQYRDDFELISKWAVQPEDLRFNLLKYKPDIVHFTGHGSKSGKIVLRGRDGKPKLVSKKALVGLFKTLKDNIRVVVLSACYTKKQTGKITEEIDCAVGTRKAISQKAAIAFAASFYEGIAFNRSVQEAFDLGVNGIALEGIPEESAPMLFCREGVDPAQVYLIGEKQEPSDTEESEIQKVFTAKLPVNKNKLLNFNRLKQPTVYELEFTLDIPMSEFNAQRCEDALKLIIGQNVSKVRITGIRKGSTKVNLIGDPKVLIKAIKSLDSSPQLLREFSRDTKLKKVVWVLGNKRYELSVTGPESCRIQTTHIRYGVEKLFGREEELKLLDAAWDDPKMHIITIVAWGGVGKTSLVAGWLARMAADGWRGAKQVFDWSFYSQGVREQGVMSSNTFLAEALRWFGDEGMAKSAESPWDKGVCLAKLVGQGRNVFVLDGLEPLQYPPGPMQGRLKDAGLQGLLRELSHGMDGLCIITTREDVKDLGHCVGHTVKRVELDNLSPAVGSEFLRYLGVKGTEKELKEAAREFKGHALALALLGRYLAVVHNGKIRKKDLVPALMEEEERGGYAKRVMKSYEIWLEGTAELNILYLMGLFDRPAESAAIKKLREGDAIKGLTEQLQKISDEDWDFAVENLRDLRLLGKGDKLGVLDCHPLVREHFGEKLKNERIEAWREAHGRLYEYYKGVPEKEEPDTLEEMEPLFRAVYHGCAAGKHQETFDDVYWERIKRGNEHYSTKKLGAFGSDLGAMACFFELPWRKVSGNLNRHSQILLLNLVGYTLRALGRLREALEPIEESMEQAISRMEWLSATIVAENISRLQLTLGNVEKAVDYRHKCAAYADKSGNKFWRIASRTAFADALHQAGEIGEAKQLFEEAEEMQKERQPEYEYLYLLGGYRYCDLLLALGEYEEVKERAKQMLKWAEQAGAQLLTFALDKLLLGQVELAKLRIEKLEGKGAEKCLTEAGRWLDEAVDGLRKAGTQHNLPLGLLARAGYYRVAAKWGKGKGGSPTEEPKEQQSRTRARGDLEEAREIAERGEMKLHLADYHLESTRLLLDEKKKGDAKGHYDEAKRLVEECGYHRRDEELKDIEGRM